MCNRNTAPAPLLVLLAMCCAMTSLAARAAITDYVDVKRIASGLQRPVYVTHAPGDKDRLFIVEQGGAIRILQLADKKKLNAAPFLSVGGLAGGGEQGLLGLAFHPDYENNGFFYLNLTDTGGATNIVRYTVSASNPDLADAGSAMTLLTFSQPQSNHNGGWLGFGPDGYLYIASGDGGGGDDNDAGHTAGTGNAQDLSNNLLGKMLRIDVDGDDFPIEPQRNYAIPADNPFVGTTGDDEIWSYGLRNPWRASFDRLNGDLYIADVGQEAREEVNVQNATSAGGENYGWRLREGTIATPTGGVGGPPPAGAVDPVYDYTHGSGDAQGRSVTGGYVYRGPNLPLSGRYFFGDFVTQRIWSIQHDGVATTEFIDWTDAFTPDVGSIGQIASFGEDARGNLYVVDLGGEVFRVEPICALDLSNPNGIPTMDFQLGLAKASWWFTFLLSGNGLSPLWVLPLPPLPATSLSLPFPGLSNLGPIAVITLVVNADGLVCSAVDGINSGP